MVLNLLGVLFTCLCTGVQYGEVDVSHTYTSQVTETHDYSLSPIGIFRYEDGLTIKHPSGVYSPTSIDFNISFDYLINGATYHFDFGNISLIFEYSNSQYSYDITPKIFISCDNSDFEFNYYNVLPVYTISCVTNSEHFNFTKTIYDTNYCSLSTQYDFNETLNRTTLNNNVSVSITGVALIVNFIQLSEVDLSDNYNDGYNTGYNNGKDYGYNNGYDVGYYDGNSTGYQNGYNSAREEFENQDAVVTSIFDGILGIGLLPVEFLMSIFNFEILGINFTHIISALLSLMVLVILLRIVLGGKGGEK